MMNDFIELSVNCRQTSLSYEKLKNSISQSNKEEMFPSPPLLGTPRASFPARGSRLKNPFHVTVFLWVIFLVIPSRFPKLPQISL